MNIQCDNHSLIFELSENHDAFAAGVVKWGRRNPEELCALYQMLADEDGDVPMHILSDLASWGLCEILRQNDALTRERKKEAMNN